MPPPVLPQTGGFENTATGKPSYEPIWGSLENFGRSGFMWSHGCALNVQISPIGLNQLGSSRLPALITIMPLPEELSAKSGEPHSAQKPRRAVRPLAAVTE